MDPQLAIWAEAEQEQTGLSSSVTLGEAYNSFGGDEPISIPLLVWLLENPKSQLALPGKISLFNHDCLHILFGLGFSAKEEAFLVGFAMGTDPSTRPIHLMMLKFFAKQLYPHPYRFSQDCLDAFDVGVKYGERSEFQNLYRLDFSGFKEFSVDTLRRQLGISTNIYLNGELLTTLQAAG